MSRHCFATEDQGSHGCRSKMNLVRLSKMQANDAMGQQPFYYERVITA